MVMRVMRLIEEDVDESAKKDRYLVLALPLNESGVGF